jgi:hypothetical protein
VLDDHAARGRGVDVDAVAARRAVVGLLLLGLLLWFGVGREDHFRDDYLAAE